MPWGKRINFLLKMKCGKTRESYVHTPEYEAALEV